MKHFPFFRKSFFFCSKIVSFKLKALSKLRLPILVKKHQVDEYQNPPTACFCTSAGTGCTTLYKVDLHLCHFLVCTYVHRYIFICMCLILNNIHGD
jgi:hypothetical protein